MAQGPSVPRYFFHLRDGAGPVLDEEGMELDGLEAAREVAVTGARSLVAADALAGTIDLRASIEVADEAGTTLLSLGFAEAVEILGASPSAPAPTRAPGGRRAP